MKQIKRPYMLGQEPESLWNAATAVLLCILIAFTLLNFRFLRDIYGVNVSGVSMEDTLKNGDFLYADRNAVPARGDVVIIDVTNYREKFGFSGDNIIKRLIAVEGDTVRITGGNVYLRAAGETEFVPLEEDYTKGATYTEKEVFECTVGEGEIFFLGDHRTNSTDSRAVGCLRLGDVVGVVEKWSLMDKEVSRWGAFFKWVKNILA